MGRCSGTRGVLSRSNDALGEYWEREKSGDRCKVISIECGRAPESVGGIRAFSGRASGCVEPTPDVGG
jgi:hypothetical protein